MARRRRGRAYRQRHRPPLQDRLIPICREGFGVRAGTCGEPVDSGRTPNQDRFVRSVHLTKRGHIDLLRVASAACRRSI
ncbi:putative leader peptide [Micromonospora sp. NPDC007208]|uniref:putative leader peptide n=1 Tax=Micromonospora sp. NPDC007208 TaxID=3364236 RepID=UPI0036AC1479